MSSDQFESQSKAIFKGLPAAAPSPFFAARVVANLKPKASRELTLWRWVAALSLAAVVGLATYMQMQTKHDLLYTFEPYVMQVDFNASELKLVESAEIQLPEGVTFVSKNESIKSLRSLKLPISGTKNGKLPFVLMSNRTGELPVEIKMYDAQDALIQTKTVILNFEARG